MKAHLSWKAEQLKASHRRHRFWRNTVIFFACIVVFLTTYALILPAITMEKTVTCGLEEHQHSEECYEEHLICTLSENETHTHTAECYERVFICGKQEHTHSEENGCYDTKDASLEETTIDTSDNDTKTGGDGTENNGDNSLTVKNFAQNNALDTASLDEEEAAGIPAAQADGEDGYTAADNVQLYMYYCTYEPSSSATKINGYIRNSVKTDSGSTTFTIDGAYTDGTYYLIPVQYFIDNYAKYGYTFDKENVNVCPVLYKENSAYSSPRITNYIQYQNAWYIQIKVSSSGTTNQGYVYYVALESNSNTITPSSTIINLFDYWTTGRYDDDNHVSNATDLKSGINENHVLKFGKNIGSNYGLLNYSWGGTSTPSKVTQGIVSKLLGDDGYPHFSGNTSLGMAETDTDSLAYLFDPYTEAAGKASFAHVSGILCQNDEGYYSYDATKQTAELDEKTNSAVVYTTPGVSYSSSGTTKGQFFPFNDAHQTALLSATDTPVNHYFGVSITARFIQQYGGNTTTARNTPVTFDFSGDNDVWIYIDNVLVADLGGLRSAASVSINFATGDVTIDDKGTTRNATGTPNTSIREAFVAAGKGEQWTWSGNTFEDNTIHTLKFFYLERGNYDSNLNLKYNLNQVPPSSIYKIDQYGDPVDGARFAIYQADENYNYLTEDNNICTSDQVKGFTIDAATGTISDGNTPVIKPAYCGVTKGGELLFADMDGMPYSMGELETLFGNHFILREIDVPDGYRTVSDEAYLTIDGDAIICSNTYKSGMLAKNNALITATNTLYVAREYAGVAKNLGLQCYSSETIDGDYDIYRVPYYSANQNERNGTLFSVVLKRNTRDFWHGYGYDYWYPVYGSDLTGYHTVTEGVPDEPEDWSSISYDTADVNIAAVLTAAKNQKDLLGEDALIFKESGNGMQLLLENLPGKINRYYSWLLSNNKLGELTESTSDPQYVVSYYWTSANSLDEATETNTVRVYSHDNLVSNVDGFQLQWGSTLSVPNMENRLLVQKTDGEMETAASGESSPGETSNLSNLVDGAVFAMYDVGEDENENLFYYAGTGTDVRVYLDVDDNGDNKGTATVREMDGNKISKEITGCTYSIDANVIGVNTTNGAIDAPDTLGEITVTTPDNKTYIIYPSLNADGKKLVGATHATCEIVSEDGTAHFVKLKASSRDSETNGTYVLKEIWAPSGFQLNTWGTRILVNSNGVYANAGNENNGISVGNGLGYLTKTLYPYGSLGEIDETLSWIYIALLVNDNRSFSAFEKVADDVLILTDEMIQDGWHFAKKAEGDEAGHASDIANHRSQAMTSYLVFNEQSAAEDVIFNYSPNSDQSARSYNADTMKKPENGYDTLAGEGMVRLFTKNGWSDAAAYQDYYYGIIQPEVGTKVNYDDLTGYGNISNLFSSSTWVQVSDKSHIDMTVAAVSASTEKPLPCADFTLWKKDNTGKKYYYSYQDGVTKWVAEDALDSLNGVTFSTDENGTFPLYYLPDGAYSLQEISPPAGYASLVDTISVNINKGIVTVPTNSGASVSGDLKSGQTVTVKYYTGYKLPGTGGTGTARYRIAGLILAGISALLLFCLLRRKSANRQTKKNIPGFEK